MPQDALICYLTPFVRSRPTVFLWGDSHAWMQIPGLLKAAQGRNVNVVASVFGSCPPMDPGLSWARRYELGRCAASNVVALRFLKQMVAGPQDFKLVMAGNWDMYERALKLLAQGKKPGKGHAEYAFAQSKIFRKGGPRLMKQLAAMNVDTDVIGQVARPPANPKPCKRMDPYACDFPRKQAFRNERSTISWLHKVMAPALRGGGQEIYVNEFLCSPSTCHGRVNGVWTFHDNSHITASMARLLAPYYAQSVADVVPGMSAPDPDGTVVAGTPCFPRTRRAPSRCSAEPQTV